MTKCEQTQSVHERNRVKLERKQRIITIARKRAGLSQAQLAKRIYVAVGTMSCYENGKLSAPWDLLESILPELKEMREKGCEAYCQFAQECKGGRCKYRDRGVAQKKVRGNGD